MGVVGCKYIHRYRIFNDGIFLFVMFLLCKQLIAEAWDAGGLYQVGMFPHWGIWSEWNGKVSKCITRINYFSFYCLRYSLHETYAYSRNKGYGKVSVTVYKGFKPNVM